MSSGNEAEPEMDTLAEEILRAAITSVYVQELDVRQPDYPFDDGFKQELILTLVNGKLSKPPEETKTARDERHMASAVTAADIARGVIRRANIPGKDIEGVMYYPEKALGLAALAGAANANRRSVKVLAKWKDALTKDPLDRIKSVIQALGAHMCIEDPIGKLTENKGKAKS